MSAVGDFIHKVSIGAAVTRLARVRTRAWWVSLLIGTGCAIAIVAVRASLGFIYGNITGFMILLPAVIVASLAGGRLAGLTATLVCLVGGWIVVGFDTVGAGLASLLK